MRSNQPVIRICTLVAVSFLLLSSVAWSQTLGDITGVVTDRSGGVLVGARVTVTNPQTGLTRQVATNSAGNYTCIGLPDWVPAKAGAPVNRSAESRRLAAELEKIKKEQPNLWTNAAVSFRI
jgi:hypothetical protein